jgi:outer membrane lipoprotein SlyB
MQWQSSEDCKMRGAYCQTYEQRTGGYPLIVKIALFAVMLAALAGCNPSFSPDTYNTSAMQQSNKVEQGVIAGVRDISVSASGATGAVTGAAAGGIVGSQTGTGMGSALGAVGGSLIGGLAGAAVEHVATDTKAYEYIVRKTNGEMVSVTQKDEKPLAIGQKVLVIGGNQARIVADYTVPVEPGTKDKPAETAKDGAPAAPQSGPVVATSPAPAAVLYPDPAKVGSPSASGGSAAASLGAGLAVPAGASPATSAGATATPSAAATPAAASTSAASPIATATPAAAPAPPQPAPVAGPTVVRNDATP